MANKKDQILQRMRWGAIATSIDLRTGKVKQTCMYCYAPWHYEHYCAEPGGRG